MKTVIDISEKDYRKVQDGRASVSMMRKTIRNGIPLPKGHGKIVDIKPLMVGLYEGMGKETFSPIEVYKMLDEECRVIIEADKEGAEDATEKKKN